MNWIDVGSMAVVATVVAKGLDYFGYIGRRSAERDEALNEMTFLLLEARQVVRSLNSTEVKAGVETYLKMVEVEVGIGPMPNEIRAQASQYIENAIFSIALQKVRSSFEGLKASYLPTAQRIAKFRPVLAYRLNGREQILEVFELLDRHISDWNVKFSEPPEEMKAEFVARTKNLALDDLLGDIEEDVLKVAWAAGPTPWLRVKRFLQEKKRGSSETEKLQPMIRDLVQMLKEMAQAVSKNPEQS